MERGEEVVMAARNGDVEQLEWLIMQREASIKYRDEFGFTALAFCSH